MDTVIWQTKLMIDILELKLAKNNVEANHILERITNDYKDIITDTEKFNEIINDLKLKYTDFTSTD